MKVCLCEEDQRKELVNEFDYNVLVEAGAGSGKTTIIINRVINQLINTKITISQIVAITFTNKAANELKERLQKALSLKAKDKSINEENRYKLSQALENIDKMHISTIHSFCNSMLSERPFDANLSLGFKFVEDSESIEIKREVFEDYIKNMTKEENDKIQNLGVNSSQLIDSFLYLADKKDIDIAYDKNIVNEEINNYYREITMLLRKTLEEIKEYKEHSNDFEYLKKGIRENIVEYEKVLKEAPSSKSISIAKEFLKQDIGLKKGFDGVGKEINEWFECDIKDSLEKYINMVEIYKHAVLTEIIIKIINKYDDVKKEEKIVTNDDLLYLSKEMVKHSASARKFFQNKYETFYIDEFQDTDPIQTELFFYLASESYEKSFWNNKLKPGSLFLVGDPKQSIYGFRGADIERYNRVKYTFEDSSLANAKVYTLIMNYRSTDELCKWIENTFKIKEDKESKFGFSDKNDENNNQAVFGGIKSGVDLNKEGLEDQEIKYLDGIYEYDVNSFVDESDRGSRGIKNDIIIKYDSKYLADTIYKMVSSKMQLLDKTISYDDFLIITWDASNNKMDKYVEALEEKGIPVNIQGKVKVDRLNEISNLVELLRYLNNPYDRIQLGIVLSKNFDIKIENINFEKINEKLFGDNSMSLPYRSVWSDNIDKIEDRKVKSALKLLKELIKEKYEMEPIEYIEKIVNNYFYLLKDEEEYDSIKINSCFGSLMQFIESLRNVEYSNFNNLVEIINDKLSEVNKREMPINHINNGAVRIMNLHQAKGLEGNIVILACPSKRSTKEVNSYVSRCDESTKGYYCINSASQYGVTAIARPWGLAECFPNGENKSFVNKAKDNNEKEFTRLNYVAATRAKRVLIISRSSDLNSEKNWGKLLKGSDLPKIEECSNYSETYKIIDITSKIAERKEQLIKVKEKIKKKTYKNLSPSGLNGKVGTDNKEKKTCRPYGKEFGTMIHRMFELIVDNRSDILFGNDDSKKAEEIENIIKLSIYETANDIEITERVIKELYLDNNIKNMSKNQAISSMYKSLHDVFLECAHRFVNDNDIRCFLENAKRVYTELPFSIFLDRTEDESLNKLLAEHYDKKTEEIKENKIWINGIMDLVIENNDSTYTIIDYKTTRPSKDEDYDKFMDDLLKKYLGQLKMYKYVLNKIFGKDVEVNNLEVYSFEKDGNIVEVDKK